MTKKLVKHGNSLALLIEKPILKILGIDEHTDLQVKIEGNSLIIEAAGKEKTRHDEIREIAQQIMDQYDPVFRKLSKT
jgi:antitoxin component of MazEF toxin-antitoxin module